MLLRSIAAVTAVVLVCAAPAGADTPSTSTDTCLKNLTDVETTLQGSDVGDKAQAEVEKLIDEARQLCEQGQLTEADSVIQVARTKLATE